MKRIVVTGLGTINALGMRDASFKAVVAGECGIGPITLCDTAGLSTTIAAEVKDFDPTAVMKKKELKKAARFIQLGLAAADEALEDAGLVGSDLEAFGVVSGNGMGGYDLIEKTLRERTGHISPFFIPAQLTNMLAGQLSIRYGLRGPNLSVSTACAAGTHAINEAFKTLKSGMCEAMLVVGAESTITPAVISGFGVMNALSRANDDPKRASRPFDAERSGFVMGEGAGALVVETLDHALARGAQIYAEIAGIGESGDASHITTPDAQGRGVRRTITMALETAGLAHVDYINAHGTSTRYNDLYEAEAIAEIFGGGTAVSSTKGQLGHCLGAAGAIEAVMTLMAMQAGVVPPTINYSASEPEMAAIDLVANTARELRVATAMSCNFGFGGTNAAVIFRRWESCR